MTLPECWSSQACTAAGSQRRCRSKAVRLSSRTAQPLNFAEGVAMLKSSPDLRFGVRVHETTFRVNVRWVTPLGEETASTS